MAYVGKIRYKHEVHNGEHPAIVDPAVFARVQALLHRNGRTRGAPVRNKFGALLKGLLRCVPCGCAMTPTHTTKDGNKRYRYYVCSSAQKRGWNTCPSKSIPAAQIEQLVVEQIRCIGKDPDLLQATITQARAQDEARLAELEAERRGLDRELARWHAELQKIPPNPVDDPTIARLADLQERIRLAEDRTGRVREEAAAIRRRRIDDDEVALALSVFDPVWESLTPAEQARVVQLLVERVDYDGARGKVSITFQPAGIKTLADELADQGGREKIA
ncbi:MAG: zinc ribbon domain-containing protein [Pirellulales bacterium]|nr:zinc ribbon domain-containing protein [Pirellulales bacterium]